MNSFKFEEDKVEKFDQKYKLIVFAPNKALKFLLNVFASTQ